MGQWVINYYGEKRARGRGSNRKSFSLRRSLSLSHLIFIRPLISLSKNVIFWPAPRSDEDAFRAICLREM